MRVIDLLNSLYTEETLPIDKNTNVRKKGILLLDIDDTLLKAKNIFIWRKLPTDKEEVKLTPDQFKREDVTAETKPLYDMREFRDKEKVRNSIKNGVPYIHNLKVVDKFVNGGFVLGILTARGMEDVVYEAISDFLKYRDKDGNLKPVELPRSLVFAVNDDNKRYSGNTDYDKKQNVIRKVQRHFDYVYFMDDDMKNINAVKAMKRTLPAETAKKIRTITATNPKDEEVTESTLTLMEMAMNMFDDAKLKELVDTDPKAAGHYYIDMVIKDNPSKYGDLHWKTAATKIASYGLSKSGSAAIRKGQVTPEFVAELKKGLKLAQADEPEEEKAKRLAAQRLEKAKEESKSKEDETKKSSPLGRYELVIEKIKAEKDRVEVSKRTLDNELNKSTTASSSSTSSVHILKREEELEEYKKFIKGELLPPFILDKKLDSADETRVEKELEGKEFRREGVELRIKIENYINYLNNTIEMFNDIVRDTEGDEDAKVEALKSDKIFQQYLTNVTKTLGKKSKLKERRAMDAKRASRRTRGGENDIENKGVTGPVKEYYDALEAIEKAYNNKTLREYVAKNFQEIRAMVQRSSIGTQDKNSKYKAPKGFDKEPIEEASEEQGLLDGLKNLGPAVQRIIQARKGNDYAYSGIERNDPEIEYLYNYQKKGTGKDSVAFRILVNIYLDFIDGMGVVVSSKNKGLLGDNVVRTKKRETIENKEDLYSKMGVDKKDPSRLSPDEAKQVVIWKLERLQSMPETNRVETKKTISNMNFTNISKEDRDKLVKASMENLQTLESALEKVKENVVSGSDMSEDELYKIVERRISQMTPAQRFQNRTAVAINFVKKVYNKEDLKVLAKATFNDPTGEKFINTLKDSRFSQKR